MRLGGAWVEAAIGRRAARAASPGAAWALDGVDDPADLWRAELAWWRRVAADAERLTRSRLDGGEVAIGAVALLAFDAMRLAVALAVAAQGGRAPAREVFDALC